MKTLSIIAAALVSGAAYGQPYESSLQRHMREGQEQLQQLQAQEQARQIHEQLEELEAAQRRACYEDPIPLPDPLRALEERRIERNRESYLRDYLEDCE